MELYGWKKNGQISIWNYVPAEKNYPGWHVGADYSGYQSLGDLLSLLKASPVGSKRTLDLDFPARKYAAIGIRKNLEKKVVLVLASNDAQWQFSNMPGKLTLMLGTQGVGDLLNAVTCAQKGEYDFCIESEKGQRLWFW